jgi:hypothetical protein
MERQMSTEQQQAHEIARVTLEIPKQMHMDLKIRAIREEKTLKELMLEMINKTLTTQAA